MAGPTQRRLIFTAVVTAAFFAAAELGARQASPVLPRWGNADNNSVVMTGHPTRLWGLAEGTRSNLDQVATINALGLRGTIPVLPRPKAEPRIAILGDSSFFGFGVGDSDTLPARLAKRMPDITVINGGIPGYSTAQTIRLLDERVWALEPTLLVLASFWSDTKYESFRDKDLLASLDLGQSQFLASSALVRWMAPWVSQFRSEDSARIVTWVHGDALPAASQRRVGVVDYAKNLDHIVRAAAKRGIGVVLLTPPSPVEIEAKVNPPHQWDAYRAVQKAVAKHHGLAHIEMTPVFKAVYDNDSPPILSKLFLDDLHPSVKGQIIMAQMLQRVLAQRGWPQDQILGKPDSPFDTSGLTASHHAGRASQPADPSSPVSNLFVSPKVKQDRARQPAAQAGVRVQIKGGAGPYRLTVQSQGRTVASATVQSPRVVQLRLRGVAGEVHLEVTDGVGEIRQQRLTVGSQRPTNASFDFGALK